MGGEELAAFFLKAVLRKPKGHFSPGRGVPSCERMMSTIGG
jgi:hypothetical protein